MSRALGNTDSVLRLVKRCASSAQSLAVPFAWGVQAPAEVHALTAHICDRTEARACWILSRSAHTGLYVHHTNPGSVRGALAVSLGIVHALDKLYPGLGYFRPIDQTTIGGNRALLMRDIYGFKDDVESMQGVSQRRAFELITLDKMDDLMEEVYKEYEAIKGRHDFLVVEGTNLKGYGGDVVSLNAKMASTLGTSALFATDARGVRVQRGELTKEECQQDVLESIKLSDVVFRRENVDVLSTIVHGFPAGATDVEELAKRFHDMNMSFAGAIPEDRLLHSLQVDDVARSLGSELLYEVRNIKTAMSTEITDFVIATVQLSDLLTYLPTHRDSSKGSAIIADSSRTDILLGLLQLHELNSCCNVAAVILTGGKRPQEHIELLVRDLAARGSLPILLSPMPAFETSALLSRVEASIQPDSYQKIERAQLNFEEYIDMGILYESLLKEQPLRLNPKLFQHNLFTLAKLHKKHIVLAEGEEPRIVQAAAAILRRGVCELSLLGKKEKIEKVAKQFRVDISQAHIIDPPQSPKLETYRDFFFELRKHKGVNKEQAHDVLMDDPNYFGTCMVAVGDADGMVSGAIHTTANTVRPALQIIKTPPDLPLVSSVFFMCLPDRVLVYGDCAINSNPSSEELATIAIQSADTATAFGIEARVAMLSYATGNSNTGPLIQKVIDATAIAKKKRPDLLIEGPLQYDAAVNVETARTKLKGNDHPVAGQASVLIFPDLNTGNNTYKAVQQSTGAVAMGPLLQGLRKPVNDLSRGCTVMDIVTTVALTAIQAGALKLGDLET